MATNPGATPDMNKSAAAAKKPYYQNQRRGVPAKPNIPKQVKFEGRCSDLKGHIYDCRGTGQADLYAKTTLELTIYIGNNYKNGADTQQAIENMEMPLIIMPLDPAQGATNTETRIWEKQVDQYVKRLEQLDMNI